MSQDFDEPVKGGYITINENKNRIELHGFENDVSHSIYKIVKKYENEKDKDIVLYDVEISSTETDSSGGMVFFQVNKFYKIIRFGGGQPGVPNLKNYLEYQYK